jgi:hypothetical protein
MRKAILVSVMLLGLAGCGVPPPSTPQAAIDAPDSVLPSRSNTVFLPDGKTITCTAYAGAVCPRI